MHYLISKEPSDVAIVTPNLPMRKLRHREVKEFAQGHTTCCWWSWTPSPSQELPSPIVWFTVFHFCLWKGGFCPLNPFKNPCQNQDTEIKARRRPVYPKMRTGVLICAVESHCGMLVLSLHLFNSDDFQGESSSLAPTRSSAPLSGPFSSPLSPQRADPRAQRLARI